MLISALCLSLSVRGMFAEVAMMTRLVAIVKNNQSKEALVYSYNIAWYLRCVVERLSPQLAGGLLLVPHPSGLEWCHRDHCGCFRFCRTFSLSHSHSHAPTKVNLEPLLVCCWLSYSRWQVDRSVALPRKHSAERREGRWLVFLSVVFLKTGASIIMLWEVLCLPHLALTEVFLHIPTHRFQLACSAFLSYSNNCIWPSIRRCRREISSCILCFTDFASVLAGLACFVFCFLRLHAPRADQCA